MLSPTKTDATIERPIDRKKLEQDSEDALIELFGVERS